MRDRHPDARGAASSGCDENVPLVEALWALSVSGVSGHIIDEVEAARNTELDHMRRIHVYDEIPNDSAVGKRVQA